MRAQVQEKSLSGLKQKNKLMSYEGRWGGNWKQRSAGMSEGKVASGLAGEKNLTCFPPHMPAKVKERKT